MFFVKKKVQKLLSALLALMILVQIVQMSVYAQDNTGKEDVKETTTNELAACSDSEMPDIVCEVKESRDQFSKEYLLEDGSFCSIISTCPINKKVNGKWEDNVELSSDLSSVGKILENIQSIDSLNSQRNDMPDRSEITENNLVINWCGATLLPSGLYELSSDASFLIKPQNVSNYLSQNKLVVYAALSLGCSVSADTDINIFREDSTWTSTVLPSDFDDVLDNSENIISYKKITTSGTYSWIITDLYSKWDRGLIDNNGIIFNSSDSNIYVNNPCFVIRYYDVEPDDLDFTYHSNDLGKSGEININDITNTFRIDQDLINLKYGNNEFKISRSYDSAKTSFNSYAGIGMNFNFESSIALFNGYAEWLMLNGNKIRFAATSPLVVNGDYQQWKLIDSNDINIDIRNTELWIKTSEVTNYTSSTSVNYGNIYVLYNGLKYSFNSAGELTAVRDVQAQADIWTFSYDSGNKLRTITELNGNKLVFDYQINSDLGCDYIQQIVAQNADNEILKTDENNDLKVVFSTVYNSNTLNTTQSVTFANGDICTYIYDSNARLTRFTDEQGNACELSYVVYPGGEIGHQISGYSLYRENASAPYYSIEISADDTYHRQFVFSDGTSEDLYYSNDYKLITYEDSNGKYTCFDYDEEGLLDRYINDGAGDELIDNSSFEQGRTLPPWDRSSTNSIARSNGQVKTGSYSVRLGKSAEVLEDIYLYEDISDANGPIEIEEDKTFFYGAWMYSEGIITDPDSSVKVIVEVASTENTLPENIDDSDYVVYDSITFDNTIQNDWQLRMKAFKTEESCLIRIKIEYENQMGYVYIDDTTLYEANDYSVVFSTNTGGTGFIEYTYNGNSITGETITWERSNEDDIYMSASYSYGSNNKLQEHIDFNGIPTYYKYSSRTGQKSGTGHKLENNVISDVRNIQYDASALLSGAEQVIKNVETNADVTLDVDYFNESGKVVEVHHNGYSHIFEYNSDETLVRTYADNDNLLSYDYDQYCMDYTYSNGDLSIIDYSNGYRVKYLTGTDNQGNATKTIGCYSVNGENETLIKSYVYTFDEDGILSSIYDNSSGLTITYTDSDLLSYEISDYELLYKRTVNSDGTVSEQYRQRNYTNNQNTSFDTLETSETVVSYNSDGTRTMTSSVSAEKNTSYYNYGTYYHGTFDYEKESVRDYFDRISSKSVEMIYQRDNTPGNISSQVEYDYTDLGNGRTSGLVSDYSQSFCKQNNNNTISTCQTYNRKYEYDNKGNIQFVYEVSGNTTVPKQYYEYDNADQIITEINFENQISAHYTYNAGGNLTAKIYYDFSTLSFNVTNRQIVSLGQEIRRVSYQYDSVWKDRVIYYSDTGFTDDNEDDSVYQAITYDKMGNPLKYVGDKTLDLAHFAIQSRSPDRIIIGDLEWNGNRLVSFEISDKRYEYNYDANGFRTSKITYNKTTNSGNTTYEKSNIIDYYWDNGVLTGISSSSVNSQGQRINTQTAMIIYDQEGTPTGYLSLAGVPYLFKKDLNENVLSLVYTDGTDICSVRYDAWGSPQLTLYGNIIQQAVAMVTVLLCPVSYHGYLYDYESGLYFNQGRCYSPSWGRYVSPESPEKLTNRSENPLDSNLYLFCNNNTINTLDTVASWSRDYTELDWQANGFDIKMNEMFASRPMCMLVANELIKKYGKWYPEYGYALFEMNSLRISSDLFAHYIGKTATAAINKVNACWGDGWILSNKKSDIIKVRNDDPNASKYLKVWKAAPEIRAYAQKEGIYITL